MKSGNLREKTRPWTFTPVLQDEHPSEVTFYLRTSRDPLALAQAARKTVASLDASLPVFNVKTVARQMEETHFLDRLFAWLSIAFGVLAFALSCLWPLLWHGGKRWTRRAASARHARSISGVGTCAWRRKAVSRSSPWTIACRLRSRPPNGAKAMRYSALTGSTGASTRTMCRNPVTSPTIALPIVRA